MCKPHEPTRCNREHSVSWGDLNSGGWDGNLLPEQSRSQQSAYLQGIGGGGNLQGQRTKELHRLRNEARDGGPFCRIVAADDVHHGPRKPRISRLQVDVYQFALQHFEDLFQNGNPRVLVGYSLTIQQRMATQFRRPEFCHGAASLRDAVDYRVMHYHYPIIPAQTDIQLDGVSALLET